MTEGIGMGDALEAAGYTVVDPCFFHLGTEGFTALISAYRKAGYRVNVGSNPGRDFPSFWTQCLQQGQFGGSSVANSTAANGTRRTKRENGE